MLHHLRLESGKKLFPPERPGRGTPPTLRREGYVIWLRLRRAGFPVVKRSGQERAHGLPVAEFGQPPRVAGVSLHPAFHSRLARPRFLKGGGSTGAGIRREHREYGDRPWRTVSRKSTRRWAGRSRWRSAVSGGLLRLASRAHSGFGPRGRNSASARISSPRFRRPSQSPSRCGSRAAAILALRFADGWT